MQAWQLQEAKARLSEVVRLSHRAPQLLTLRGEKEAVVLSWEDYVKQRGEKPDFISFMNASPLKGLPLDISRDQSLERDTEL